MENHHDDIGPEGLTQQERERRRREGAAVGGDHAKRNWLPLIIGALVLLGLLILLLRGCDNEDPPTNTTTDTAAMDGTGMTSAGGATGEGITVTAYQRGGLATYFAGNQPLGQTYELSQVTFDSGSAELGAAANEEIADVAGALQARSTARVSLRGYADPAGDAAANRQLSQQRAEAVRDALVKAGAGANQVEIAALGETGATATRQNRRVELTAIAR